MSDRHGGFPAGDVLFAAAEVTVKSRRELFRSYWELDGVPGVACAFISKLLRPGCGVPQHVLDENPVALVLVFKREWPMDLVVSDDHLLASLSFGGDVRRCSLPWGAAVQISIPEVDVSTALYQGVAVVESLEEAKEMLPDQPEGDVIEGPWGRGGTVH